MKNKLFAALLVLLALSLAMAPAWAEGQGGVRYPDQRGAVTDDANVLSDGLVRDIASFQTLAFSRADVNVQVVIVHFLDGMEVQAYANALFNRWGLGDDDFLLLGAVGEDSFASASGADVKARFTDSNAQSLLYTSKFSELFKAQQYDAAFGHYFVAFSDMLGKQFSADISLGNLFASAQPGQTAAPTLSDTVTSAISKGSQTWEGAIDTIHSTLRTYDDHHEQRERENNGLTPAGWIVLVILLFIIFGQSNPARKARKTAGCGCSPLGWIFGMLGLGNLLGRRKK